MICDAVREAGCKVVLPTCTVAPLAKPAPARVNVNAGPVAITDAGLSDVSIKGAVTARGTEFDVRPSGVVTVTPSEPTCAMRLAGTVTVICVAVSEPGVRVPLPTATEEPWRNPEPVTVSVNAALPAVTELGLIEVIVTGAFVTVSVTEFDVRPSGTVTVTASDPGCATTLAGTVVTICVGVKDDGARLALPTLTLAPCTNPDPVIVRAKSALPATTELGLMAVIVIGALMTLSVTVFDFRPLGVMTVTGRDPGCAIRLAGTVTVIRVPVRDDGVRLALPTVTLSP